MRILVIDTGLSLDVVRRLREEGNDVIYFSEWVRSHVQEGDILYGQGFLEEWRVKRVYEYLTWIDRVDLILFTDVYYGNVVEYLKSKGKRVIGTPSEIARLENERSFPRLRFSQYGLKFPVSRKMKISEARDFVKSKKTPFVIKTDLIGDSSIKTYVGVGVEDVLSHLQYLSEELGDEEIIVQDKVEGVEIAVGGFFNGERFLEPLCLNFEEKRIFPGGLGGLCGEMGTTILWVGRDNKLFKETLGKIENVLSKMSDSIPCYIDVNCIVNEEGSYILEFTCRFGYPLIFIQHPSIEDFTKLLLSWSEKKDQSFEVSDPWGVGVGLNGEGYPYEEVMEFKCYHKIVVLPKSLEDNYYLALAGVYKDNEGKVRICPGHGRAIVSCGYGETLSEAQYFAYLGARKVIIPNIQYRVDIGERVKREKNLLYKLGYLSSEEYFSAR